MMNDDDRSTLGDQIRSYKRPPTPEWFSKNRIWVPDPAEEESIGSDDDGNRPSARRLTTPGTEYWEYTDNDPTTTNPGPPLTNDSDFEDDDDGRTRETMSPEPRRDAEYISDLSLSELYDPPDSPEIDYRHTGKESEVASVSERHQTSELRGAVIHDPDALPYQIIRRERALEHERLCAVRLNPDRELIGRMHGLEYRGESELDNAGPISEGSGTVDEPRASVMLNSNPLMDGSNRRTFARVFEYDSEGESEVGEAESESEGPLTVDELGKAVKPTSKPPKNRHNRRMSAVKEEGESEEKDAKSKSERPPAVLHTERTLRHTTNSIDRPMHDNRVPTSSTPVQFRKGGKSVSEERDTEPSLWMMHMKNFSTQLMLGRNRHGVWSIPKGWIVIRQVATEAKATCKWNQCGEELELLDGPVTLHIEEHAPSTDTRDYTVCRWENCDERLKFGSLVRHVITKHLPMKEVQCPWCNIFLSRLDALKRHVKKSCLKRPGREIVPP